MLKTSFIGGVDWRTFGISVELRRYYSSVVFALQLAFLYAELEIYKEEE